MSASCSLAQRAHEVLESVWTSVPANPAKSPGDVAVLSRLTSKQGANPSLPINVDARISLEKPLIARER